MPQEFESLKAAFKERFGTRIDFLRDREVYSSPLFKFLRSLPKGADLHAHADAILPISEQVAFLKDHPELVITPECQIHYSGVGAPYGSRTMEECLAEGLTVDTFRHHWTVLGAGDERTWDWFEGIFIKCGSICTTPSLVQDYYTRVLRYYHSIGVEHLELRCPFFGTREDALARGEALLRALQTVREEVDPAITLRIVACGGKNDVWDPLFDTLMENAIYVREHVMDGDEPLVVAIDIVNDEDRSYSLARYEDRVRKILADNPGLHLTLHAGESLSGDNNEIAIALRCGIERLGHGFNLYRYPLLEEEIRRKGICMEICPVSNAALGYCADFAEHPAAAYRASGIPLVICSDDPAYQADEPFTGDLLAVTVGWDLSLEDIRQLCRNSILYSFLEPASKARLLAGWEQAWSKAIK
jgi:adenosine deaminase